MFFKHLKFSKIAVKHYLKSLEETVREYNINQTE